MFMCVGAFLASTFIHGLLGFPPLQGFAMIGGALWGIGNAFTLQIMNRLGMALTVLVCSTVSCLTGWATSRHSHSCSSKLVINTVLQIRTPWLARCCSRECSNELSGNNLAHYRVKLLFISTTTKLSNNQARRRCQINLSKFGTFPLTGPISNCSHKVPSST
ncbi:unnamed protein product [Cylicostephanus goldi]|uniref:Major facilitator superfamily (MFS) profile domain-containing protein n=1 Tax=Cylicostephanus goldi TaxID=71465 RepID=A0A3P6SGY3_CYLGO|nr:unnamed protein product [Cylicostephanus goldi]